MADFWFHGERDNSLTGDDGWTTSVGLAPGGGVALTVKPEVGTDMGAVLRHDRNVLQRLTLPVERAKAVFLQSDPSVLNYRKLVAKRAAAKTALDAAVAAVASQQVELTAAIELDTNPGPVQALLAKARAQAETQRELVDVLDTAVARAKAAAEDAWRPRPQQIHDAMIAELKTNQADRLESLRKAATHTMIEYAADLFTLQALEQTAPGMVRLAQLDLT